MICWYCHWGWSKQVADVFKNAIDLLDGDDSVLLYGPSHVVWEDENFEHAEYCLDHFMDDYYKNGNRFTDYELLVCSLSLYELTKIPLAIRCPEPDNYDGEHPELYPPPLGLIMKAQPK